MEEIVRRFRRVCKQSTKEDSMTDQTPHPEPSEDVDAHKVSREPSEDVDGHVRARETADLEAKPADDVDAHSFRGHEPVEKKL